MGVLVGVIYLLFFFYHHDDDGNSSFDVLELIGSFSFASVSDVGTFNIFFCLAKLTSNEKRLASLYALISLCVFDNLCENQLHGLYIYTYKYIIHTYINISHTYIQQYIITITYLYEGYKNQTLQRGQQTFSFYQWFIVIHYIFIYIYI